MLGRLDEKKHLNEELEKRRFNIGIISIFYHQMGNGTVGCAIILKISFDVKMVDKFGEYLTGKLGFQAHSTSFRHLSVECFSGKRYRPGENQYHGTLPSRHRMGRGWPYLWHQTSIYHAQRPDKHAWWWRERVWRWSSASDPTRYIKENLT